MNIIILTNNLFKIMESPQQVMANHFKRFFINEDPRCRISFNSLRRILGCQLKELLWRTLDRSLIYKWVKDKIFSKALQAFNQNIKTYFVKEGIQLTQFDNIQTLFEEKINKVQVFLQSLKNDPENVYITLTKEGEYFIFANGDVCLLGMHTVVFSTQKDKNLVKINTRELFSNAVEQKEDQILIGKQLNYTSLTKGFLINCNVNEENTKFLIYQGNWKNNSLEQGINLQIEEKENIQNLNHVFSGVFVQKRPSNGFLVKKFQNNWYKVRIEQGEVKEQSNLTQRMPI